jgi:uncharacterized small protein (DUF1192 family)
MALSERSRTTIYTNLEPLLGEEAVGEMLSYFPARDVEEPATKEFVRAEVARLESKVDAGFARLDAKIDTGMATLDARIDTGMATLDARIDTGIATLDAKIATLDAEIATLDAKIDTGMAALRAEMHDEFRQMVIWLVLAMVTISSAVGLVTR